jgi:hypothetical protein
MPISAIYSHNEENVTKVVPVTHMVDIARNLSLHVIAGSQEIRKTYKVTVLDVVFVVVVIHLAVGSGVAIEVMEVLLAIKGVLPVAV